MKRVRYSNQLRMGYLRKPLTAKSYSRRKFSARTIFFPQSANIFAGLNFFFFGSLISFLPSIIPKINSFFLWQGAQGDIGPPGSTGNEGPQVGHREA